MADEQKQFSIQRIYVKDISVETPNSPMIFTEKWEPNVEFNLNSNATPVQDNLFEVILGITVTVKVADKNAYLVEISQAGLFGLSGFSEEEMGPMLGSFCPNTLFPYAREVISDLVIKAGFPPMLLAPVNFDAVYAQHMQQASEQNSGSQTVN
ncbi:MAG TPA: protein-export chaperone SecB [Crenotrichaceae bacterium]|nr:protein-export chaperone SecB [Crenotrichaceae bacterium]